MTKFIPGWYLIYTRPRHEKKVAAQLLEAEIQFFLPLVKSLRQWHDRKKFIETPIFPSYIFVYLEQPEDFYRGLEIDGVLCYVRFGKEIARVRPDIVSNLVLITGNEQDVESTDGFFKPGQKVVIRQGALTGLTCEVVEHYKKQKLLVRVEILNRNVLASIPADAQYVLAEEETA